MSASPLSRKAATALSSKPRGLWVGGPGDEGVERSAPSYNACVCFAFLVVSLMIGIISNNFY